MNSRTEGTGFVNEAALAKKADAVAMATALADKATIAQLAAKADSAEVTAALALKADAAALASGLAMKADAATVTEELALKADAAAVISALAGKATAGEVAAKADSAAVSAALALKADVTSLTTGLAAKADASALSSGLALKADVTALDTLSASTTAELGKRALATALTSGLAGKADVSALNAQATIVAAKADMSTVNAQVAALGSRIDALPPVVGPATRDGLIALAADPAIFSSTYTLNASATMVHRVAVESATPITKVRAYLTVYDTTTTIQAAVATSAGVILAQSGFVAGGGASNWYSWDLGSTVAAQPAGTVLYVVFTRSSAAGTATFRATTSSTMIAVPTAPFVRAAVQSTAGAMPSPVSPASMLALNQVCLVGIS